MKQILLRLFHYENIQKVALILGIPKAYLAVLKPSYILELFRKCYEFIDSLSSPLF